MADVLEAINFEEPTLLFAMLALACVACCACYLCQPEWQYEEFRDEEAPPVSCCYYTFVTTCCCSAPPRRAKRSSMHPFLVRSRTPPSGTGSWRPLTSLRKTFAAMSDNEERMVHAINMLFVPILCGLYYYELYQNILVCFEANATGDSHLIYLTIAFQFAPIVHIALFVGAHWKPLSEIGVDIFWTGVQELTLTGPLIGFVQLLRDGEMPIEFIETACFAAQMLYCIIPQSAMQLLEIQTAESARLRATLQQALYTNLAIAALEIWKAYYHAGPPLNLQKYRYARHSAHWWLLPLLLSRAVSLVGVLVLGPALVVTLVSPSLALVIVLIATFVVSPVDIWGAMLFPHMWDQTTGQSWAPPHPIGVWNCFLGAPQTLAIDSAITSAAAFNRSLARCSLDGVTMHIWMLTACAASLAYNYKYTVGMGEIDGEIDASYERLSQLLVVYGCCIGYWLLTIIFLRCVFATGRNEAIDKATAFQRMFEDKREQARAAHATGKV